MNQRAESLSKWHQSETFLKVRLFLNLLIQTFLKSFPLFPLYFSKFFLLLLQQLGILFDQLLLFLHPVSVLLLSLVLFPLYLLFQVVFVGLRQLLLCCVWLDIR